MSKREPRLTSAADELAALMIDSSQRRENMKDIFRIEGFVEDKNLPKVKRLLMGLVMDFKDQPVINAKVNGKGKVGAETQGNPADLFVAYAKKHRLTDVNASDIRTFAQSIGRRPEAATYLLKLCKDAGVLRKLGKGTKSHYKVVLK